MRRSLFARQRNGVRGYPPEKPVHAAARILKESIKERENERFQVAKLPLD